MRASSLGWHSHVMSSPTAGKLKKMAKGSFAIRTSHAHAHTHTHTHSSLPSIRYHDPRSSEKSAAKKESTIRNSLGIASLPMHPKAVQALLDSNGDLQLGLNKQDSCACSIMWGSDTLSITTHAPPTRGFSNTI